MQTLLLPKKMFDAAAKSRSWVLRLTISKGTRTACFRDALISSRYFFYLVLEPNDK
jgi:hypothetical protein